MQYGFQRAVVPGQAFLIKAGSPRAGLSRRGLRTAPFVTLAAPTVTCGAVKLDESKNLKSISDYQGTLPLKETAKSHIDSNDTGVTRVQRCLKTSRSFNFDEEAFLLS